MIRFRTLALYDALYIVEFGLIINCGRKQKVNQHENKPTYKFSRYLGNLHLLIDNEVPWFFLYVNHAIRVNRMICDYVKDLARLNKNIDQN